MSDTPFIISPAGFIVDVGWGGPPKNGSGSMGNPIVTQLLPGATVQARGRGQQSLAGPLSGRQGTLQAYFVTGAPGPASIVALLTDGDYGAIAIGVDPSNQPFGVVLDQLGNTVATILLPWARPPSGVPLTVTLAWDASTPMIVVESEYMAATSADVQQPWTPFVPASLWLGSSGGMVPYGTFNGVVQKVQASNVVTVKATVVSVVEEGARASIMGDASVAALATRTVHPSSSMAGAASLTASAYLGASASPGGLGSFLLYSLNLRN